MGFGSIYQKVRAQAGQAEQQPENPQAGANLAQQPQQTAQPIAPQWGGFNSENIWGNLGDLNPTAQQYGMERDVLAGQRDAFLQPWEQKYRDARTAQGQNTDATSANLYTNPQFQNFVRSGGELAYEAPQGNGGGGSAPAAQAQTTTEQWNSKSPQQAQNSERNTALWNSLMARATQGLNVDRSNPVIRQQADAYSANEERARRDYLADTAEKAGPGANLRGEARLAAERAGQRTGSFEANLVGQELKAKRDEIAQSLESMRGMLTADEQMALTDKLAMYDNAIKEKGLSLQERGQDQDMSRALMQNDQFLRQLGLSEWDKTNYWDALRSGLIG